MCVCCCGRYLFLQVVVIALQCLHPLLQLLQLLAQSNTGVLLRLKQVTFGGGGGGQTHTGHRVQSTRQVSRPGQLRQTVLIKLVIGAVVKTIGLVGFAVL